MAQEVARPFDFEHGPVARAYLLRCRRLEHIILLNIHHINIHHIAS